MVKTQGTSPKEPQQHEESRVGSKIKQLEQLQIEGRVGVHWKHEAWDWTKLQKQRKLGLW